MHKWDIEKKTLYIYYITRQYFHIIQPTMHMFMHPASTWKSRTFVMGQRIVQTLATAGALQ